MVKQLSRDDNTTKLEELIGLGNVKTQVKKIAAFFKAHD